METKLSRNAIIPELNLFAVTIGQRTVDEAQEGSLTIEQTQELFARIAGMSEELAMLLFGGLRSPLTTQCDWYATVHRYRKQESYVGITLRVHRKMRSEACVYMEATKQVCTNPGKTRGLCDCHLLKAQPFPRATCTPLHGLFSCALPGRSLTATSKTEK